MPTKLPALRAWAEERANSLPDMNSGPDDRATGKLVLVAMNEVDNCHYCAGNAQEWYRGKPHGPCKTCKKLRDGLEAFAGKVLP